MFLSVIIPAYNEAQRIWKTLESIRAYLSKQSYEWEVIVVNNNSSDDTRQVAEKPEIRLLDEPRQGKAYAVQKGMLAATGDLRLFMDADNATAIMEIEKMLPYI